MIALPAGSTGASVDSQQVVLNVRPLGTSAFTTLPMAASAKGRGWYQASLALGSEATGPEDFEYFITSSVGGAQPQRYPADNSTVVVVVVA